MIRGAARLRLVRVLAVAAMVTALLVPAVPVHAADISFGTPEVTVSYNGGIDFTVPITSGVAPERVELRLGFPEALGPLITVVPVAGSGSQTMRYRLDLTGDGHLVPNTTITATWAAYASADSDPVLSKPLTVHYEDTSHEWQTVSGKLVTVHWYEGDEAFARKALQIAEDAVARTSALLGVTETEPIDFFIYGDETSFRAALGPGTRENVGGQAHSEIRTLFALIGPDGINDPWVGIVIPHELTHLVFDTAVHNPYRFPPRWFNEGLAVYLSQGYDPSDRNRVAAAISTKDLLPLTALTGQFPTDPDKTYLAYAESVSAIDYLVRTDGSDALYALVKAYGDGLTDDEAFTKALGRDMAAFQAGWLKELGAAEPTEYGPVPAPAGPLPAGWTGPGQTGGPAGTPAAATAAPSAAATAAPSSGGQDAGGIATGPVLVAVLGVVALVVIVLVVARRRAGQA